MRLNHRTIALAVLLALASAAAFATQYRDPADNTVVSPGAVLETAKTRGGAPNPVTSDNPLAVGASKHIASSTLTRIANATAYTGTATSPQAICLFTSSTICAPVTIGFTNTGSVNGYVTSLRLEKSTTGATGATFAVLLYQAAPNLASTFDASTYTPVSADVTSGAFVGYWSCPTQVVNGANSTYECTSTTNSGNQGFSVTDGTLRAVILTTGSYAPGSGETFNVIVDALASAP